MSLSPDLSTCQDEVVLVDQNDDELGTMEKLEAHRKGLLHRAFSVFVVNSRHQMLLQQRAAHKYHSGGLWTNTCCSHPRPGESILAAASRRLQEEMGLACELKAGFRFLYKSELDQGLTEHELDHVLVGVTDAEPMINPDEVARWRYEDLSALREQLASSPEHFTVWFRIALNQMEKLFGRLDSIDFANARTIPAIQPYWQPGPA